MNLLPFRLIPGLWGLIGLAFLLTACGQAFSPVADSNLDPSTDSSEQTSSTGERYADYEIVTLLPRDAISAIDNPRFLTTAEANESYADDELVLGVNFNGAARAYSIPMLSSHEIVNDTVGGVKIAVTW